MSHSVQHRQPMAPSALKARARVCITGLLGLFFLSPFLAAKQPCRTGDLNRPGFPALVEVDLELVRGLEGQEALPEWSKIEKLRSFYKAHTESAGPCLLVEGGEVAVQMFVARETAGTEKLGPFVGQMDAAKPFQFYGASRVKVERADQQVTREYAYPIAGPAPIADVVEEAERAVLMEDLAQLRMVRVPRIKRREAAGTTTECFLVSNITLVPSRVFDPTAAEEPDSEAPITLNARRLALEQVTQAVDWLQRVQTEVPGCTTPDGDGYWGRQITSLNLTVRELVPDLDFVTQSIRFWREVETRVQQLRDEEQSWRKEIGALGAPGSIQPAGAF